MPRQYARWAVMALAAMIPAMAVPSPAAADVRIFACEPEWAALATEVGGSEITVFSATHGRQDPHYIRARPSLIAAIRRADLLFCSGADLESGWLPILLQRGARSQVQPGQPGHLMAADHVEVLDVPTDVDRSLGHLHPAGNPHVQLRPENYRLLASELVRRLAAMDPANMDHYRARLSDFHERWSAASEDWVRRAAALDGMPVIVHHSEWVYLSHWTGLAVVATIERLPGVPPTAAHLEKVLEQTRATGAEAILLAPYVERDGAEWLSERAGIPIVDLPSTVGGMEGVDTLFDLFDITLEQLERVRAQS